MMKRCRICLLALVLCLLPVLVRAEGEQRAKDLSDMCQLELGSHPNAKKRLVDRDLFSRLDYEPGAAVAASWGDDCPAACLALQWYYLPQGVTVRQFDGDGKLLEEHALASHPESVIPLLVQARRITLTAGEAGMTLSQFHVFGVGSLPEPFHLWQETPEGLDYMLISTHPDDDVLYLGSIVSIYGAELGYTGTIVYVTSSSRTRVTEAEEGAWELGLRYHPIFLEFPDISRKATPQEKSQFSYDELLLATVRVYRQYRPAVVFAQDENGEYGHWQHKLTSQAAVEAFSLAADPDYDPESRDRFGLWQVQKVYLHLYPENTLYLDVSLPLAAFQGTDAWNVARKAFNKHKSQVGIGYLVERNDQPFAFNRFGMIRGVVEAGYDAFAHVPAELLSIQAPPAPTPTPTPTPKPSPTPVPTPSPSPAS